MEELLYAIAGGLIVWIIQQIYQNRKDARKNKAIYVSQIEKIIDKNVIYSIRPGMSMSIIHETLGTALKVFETDESVFEEETVETNSYLYSFKNANVKVTSRDNKILDSITVFPTHNNFDFETYASHLGLQSYKLNKAKVNQNLVEAPLHSFLAARHDYTFAFGYFIANPFYLNIALFGSCSKDWHSYFQNKDTQVFKDETINGICISGDSQKAYYIYQYELR